MEIIKPGTRIDFMAKRRLLVSISIATILLVLALLPSRINFGVDFAGGTEIEVKFAQAVDAKEVREQIEAAGFPDASVQQFGDASENSFLVRVQRISILSDEQAAALEKTVETELAAFGLLEFKVDEHVGDKIDLRTEKAVPLEELHRVARQAGVQLVQTGEPIRDLSRGGQPAYQILTQGLSDKVTESLHAAFGEEQVDVRRVEYVGPQVGQQLRNRGIMAVLLAAGAILLYIAFRFDVRFAPAAVLALFHDVAVVLAYWVVTGREFNLTSIAVLLTALGYSVNDTIVVFDRLREVLARKTGKSFEECINIAVNESLSRTIMTSIVTGLSLVGLMIFTTGSLFDFAGAMLVGIVAATYSSIYICGPVALWVHKKLEEKEAQKKALGGTKRRTAAAAD